MTEVIEKAYFDYNAVDKATRVYLRKQAQAGKAILQRTAQGVWEMGALLNEAKERLEHGQFMQWVASEFGLSHMSATRFMHVADRFQNSQIVNFDLSASVLYELSSPSVSEEIRDEALAEIEAGNVRTVADAKRFVAEKNGAPKPAAKPAPVAPHDDVFEDGEEPEPARDDSDPWGDDEAQAEPAPSPTLAERAKNAEVVFDNRQEQDDLTDDEWLEQWAIWRVLHVLSHKGIVLRRAMLDYREIEPNLAKFRHHATRLVSVKSPEPTMFSRVFSEVARFPSPENWLICAKCAGNGCTRCGGAGCDTTGAGIDPERVERGEVKLNGQDG